jgi:spermidine/putrescine transport system permease protein
MKKSSFFRCFSISVIWLWLGLFALLPNIALFLVTLLDRGETEYFIPVFTLGNYAQLLSPAFLSMLGESLYLALAGTLLCLLAGYPFAAYIARAPKARRPLLLLFVAIPFWTSSLIRTYALTMLLQLPGLFSTLLVSLGITKEPVSFMFNNGAILLGLTYTLLPFRILPLYASLEKLDRNLLDAARDLGAGPVRSFLHVTLPLTLPGIVAGSMLVFLPSLSCFYVQEILGGAKTMLVGTYIKSQFLTFMNWPLGAAASTILTLLLICMIALHALARKKAADKEEAAL